MVRAILKRTAWDPITTLECIVPQPWHEFPVRGRRAVQDDPLLDPAEDLGGLPDQVSGPAPGRCRYGRCSKPGPGRQEGTAQVVGVLQDQQRVVAAEAHV